MYATKGHLFTLELYFSFIYGRINKKLQGETRNGKIANERRNVSTTSTLL